MKNPSSLSPVYFVGDARFELATSSVSRKRATTAPTARGGDGIRTRVHGFAVRCLASRPLHRVEYVSERTTRFELATLTLAR